MVEKIVYVGAYVELPPKVKVIKTKQTKICSNKICNKVIETQYCPHCGAKVIEQTIPVTELQHFYYTNSSIEIFVKDYFDKIYCEEGVVDIVFHDKINTDIITANRSDTGGILFDDEFPLNLTNWDRDFEIQKLKSTLNPIINEIESFYQTKLEFKFGIIIYYA